MKNPRDCIGNRTRDLPARRTVSQPTTPPCTVYFNRTKLKLSSNTTITTVLPRWIQVLRLEDGSYSICQVVTNRQSRAHHMRAIIKCYA